MKIKLSNFPIFLLFIAFIAHTTCLEAETTESLFIRWDWKNVTNMFTSGATKGFLSYDELQDYLNQLEKNFPNVVLEVEKIGKTTEGRDIKAIHLGLKKKDASNDNTDQSSKADKPRVLFTGFLNGNDFMSTAMIIYLTNHILFENIRGNENIKYLLQNREIWIIPVINGDTYNFVSNYFNEYNRTTHVVKNRRNNDPNNICGDFGIGVDLNRNFDFFFDGLDIIPRISGDYTKQEGYICKPFYRGTKAFSEAETTSIRDFLNKRDFQVAINYIGRGHMFLTPYNSDASLSNSGLKGKEKAIYSSIEEECPFPPNIRFGTKYKILGETSHGEISDYMLGKKNIIAGSYGIGVNDEGYEESLPTAVKARRMLKENLDAALYFIYKAGINFRIEEILQGRCDSSKPDCPESEAPNYLFRLNVSNTGLKDSTEKTYLLISFSSNNVYDLQQVSLLTQQGVRKLVGLGIILEDSKTMYRIEVPPLASGESVEISPVLIKSAASKNEVIGDISQSIIVKVKDYPSTALSRFEGIILEPNFDLNETSEQTSRRNMLITIGLVVVSCWVAFGGCGYALVKHYRKKSPTKFQKLHDESVEGPVKGGARADDSTVRHRDTVNNDTEERENRRNKKRESKGGKSKSKSGSRSRDEKKKAKEGDSPKVKSKKKTQQREESPNGGNNAIRRKPFEKKEE